jgi:large subunit ribosomal protein L19
MSILKSLESKYRKSDLPQFSPGDTLRVHVKIKEGDKERIQMFQGTVIAKTGSGISESFTVRKVSAGVGVERVFPLHSPNLSKIEIIKQGKVRRSKLYYLRELKGKKARIGEKKEEAQS